MFIAGCVIGSIVGGITGVVMMCLVVTGKREDEQMERLLSEKKKERKHLLFTDSSGKELFCLPDGESIRLTAGDGECQVCICQYEDEDHMLVDGQMWQMQEFAQKMEKQGIVYSPA